MSRRRAVATTAKYLVVDEQNEIAAKAPFLNGALVRAQRLAEQAESPVSYLVDLDRVLSSPISLFSVERDKDGVVFTRRLREE